jgi:hypothetical protein
VLSGEFHGEWWTPSDPKRRYGGTLTLVSGEQPQLRVVGVMTKDLQRRLGSLVVRHPVLHGRLASGREVTLVDAYESGGEMNLMSPESGDTIITAPRAYVGALLGGDLDPSFTRAEARLSWLDDWYPPPAIEWHRQRHDGLVDETLRLIAIPPIEVQLPFGALTLEHRTSSIGQGRSEAGFAQHTWVVANAPAGRDIAWWLSSFVKPVRHLLSLATERPTDVVSLFVRQPDADERDAIEVVWTSDLARSVQTEPLHIADVLFWCLDLRPRLETALASWFGASAKLESVFDLFFATFNTARSYISTRFLMTAQSAEGYHRGEIGGIDVPTATHLERLRQAREGVDKEHRGWLNERLKPNEPTFARRLQELCEDVPEVSTMIVGGDMSEFVRAVKDLRNSLTHPDPSRARAVPSRRLAQLAAQLGVIIEAVMLHRQLGFTPADIATRIERASRLRRLAIAAGEEV